MSFCLLSMLLIAATPQDAAGPIDLDHAQKLFAAAEALSTADGGALWGRKLYGPMLFVDPGTRAVVANAPDAEGRLAKQGESLYVGQLPPTVSLGNTMTIWAGETWSMIMWPLPGGGGGVGSGVGVGAGGLMMHECFHRIQPKLGIPLAISKNHHLDTPDGRAWLRLEWRALADALVDPAPVESSALRDALIFRAYRRSLFPNAAVEENALELNEGLAEYTGIRLSGATPERQRAWAVRALGAYDSPTPLVGSFAYASGPPYGQLLDEAQPGWQRRVRRKSDIGGMLRRAIRYRLPKPLEEAAHARGAGYGIDAVLAEERDREETRQTRLTAHRARYVDGPVLLLDMRGAVNWSYNPHDMQALDDIGTVYGRMRVSAEWGILEAAGGALLIDDEESERRVAVPAPTEEALWGTPIAGDGWTLELKPGWTAEPGPRPGDYVVRRRRR